MARPVINAKFAKDLAQGDQIVAIADGFGFHGLARREDESLYVWYFVVDSIEQVDATESYQITMLPNFSDAAPGDPTIITVNGAVLVTFAIGDMAELLT